MLFRKCSSMLKFLAHKGHLCQIWHHSWLERRRSIFLQDQILPMFWEKLVRPPALFWQALWHIIDHDTSRWQRVSALQCSTHQQSFKHQLHCQRSGFSSKGQHRRTAGFSPHTYEQTEEVKWSACFGHTFWQRKLWFNLNDFYVVGCTETHYKRVSEPMGQYIACVVVSCF